MLVLVFGVVLVLVCECLNDDDWGVLVCGLGLFVVFGFMV